MARTVRDVRLDNRAARERLAPRKKPYFRLIETGKHIGYYRGASIGTWWARAFHEGKYLELKLGIADDVRDANETDVLSFSGAQAAARRWFDQLAKAGQVEHAGPYTVAQACDHYFERYQRGKAKDAANLKGRLVRIKAALGSTDVGRLTTRQIEDWHGGLRNAHPLTRDRTLQDDGTRKRRLVDLSNVDVARKRDATANRMLTVLKAVLNCRPLPPGVTITSDDAWRHVRPARDADKATMRYLTEAEATRLMNACQGSFRDLVVAALSTGCRYGELCRLRVRDFDAVASSLRIPISKSGESRSIALTDEGTAHFVRLTHGKDSDALLLVRDDGEPWQASQQLRRIAEACAAARIAPAISFHILRHTYGSRLAMRGAPMAVIAAQLGHAGTRMTERHYAHLAPSYVSDVVRKLMGEIGVPAVTDNVRSIDSAAAS